MNTVRMSILMLFFSLEFSCSGYKDHNDKNLLYNSEFVLDVETVSMRASYFYEDDSLLHYGAT
jgi:hypothetical protein